MIMLTGDNENYVLLVCLLYLRNCPLNLPIIHMDLGMCNILLKVLEPKGYCFTRTALTVPSCPGLEITLAAPALVSSNAPLLITPLLS